MWSQIHEMLYIEGGGEEQAKDEIDAYRPLIPNGKNFVFTFMFEIDDKRRRDSLLFKLGHVEDTIFLHFKNHKVQALSASEDEIDRTTADGKTSSIHFLKFSFSDEQINDLKALGDGDKVEIKVEHENYPHSVVLPKSLLNSTIEDLQ